MAHHFTTIHFAYTKYRNPKASVPNMQTEVVCDTFQQTETIHIT